MKKNITLLVIMMALLGNINPARATHILGGEIFYEYVSPGVFLATFRNYMDPSANIPAEPAVQFSLKAPGCSNQTFMYTSTLQSSGLRTYNPAGPAGSTCTYSSLIVMEALYSATITLPSNIGSCTEWYLSVRQGPKGTTANLLNPGPYYLFVSAFINPLFLNTPVNSPAFAPPVTLLFPLNAPATFSNLTLNNLPATDTVIFSLRPVLDDFNVPVPYTATTSATSPIPSSTGVNIDQNTGLLTFTPNTLQQGGGSNNRYAVMVEASVFRRIWGTFVKVSSSQRHLPLYISNASNASPEIVNVVANGTAIPPNGIVEVPAGSTVTFNFGTTDANSADMLTLLPPDPGFVGFNLTSSGSSRPSGTVTWQAPAIADNRVYYFPVSVQDNACLVRATTTRIFGVKTVGQQVGLRKDQQAGIDFKAFPNPFSNDLTFSLNLKSRADEIVIYDLLGKEVDRIFLRAGLGKQEVAWQQASRFATGTYLARLIADSQLVQVLKFTKQ